MSTKKVFTIPSEVSFLDALAEGLWTRAHQDVAQLAAMQVFLPTRRACHMLRDAFLKLTANQAMLLPRLQPLGSLDEEELLFADASIEADIPPAIAPLRRRLLLAQLIQRKDEAMPADQAVHLAEALAKFLDEAQIRRCDFGKLPGLVQQRELAEHWQETVRFLSILTEAWPQILAAEGCLDPAERRNRVLAAQTEVWRLKPPDFPIIAAGSTGTMPATADFLDVIAGLPAGAVVLPGLDRQMDEEAWQAVDELHPQHGMKDLLQVMQVERKDVVVWTNAAVSPRSHVLREAMRPAAVTEAWRELRATPRPLAGVEGLSRVTFAHPQEEAQAVALMLRKALLETDQQVALVTPDRNLAERVAVLLARWGIEANDSAGASLAEQPVGGFLSAVLAAASPHAGSVDWLSLLKHPLAACGVVPAECRARARQIELHFWRTDKPQKPAWLDVLVSIQKPVRSVWGQERPLGVWLDAHLRVAELFATSDTQTGAARLWAGDIGEVTTGWLDELREAAVNFTPVMGEVYQNLFNELLRQSRYRPAYGLHPRLRILGPLEARLLRPDFVVMGGMNEGVWPPEAEIDPWMSRPMKKDFGMSPPEHRIGLSAHDFVQLASAPCVVMTRSIRAGGSPTVPSRFLLQLETVLRAMGSGDMQQDMLAAVEPWQQWAQMLDEPPADAIKPCAAPEPRPPLALRPKSLSVTEIGTWQRNPYAIYAKHVLRLRKLDALEAEVDAADRGNLIHQALETFINAYPEQLPADAASILLEIGRVLFARYEAQPEVKAFWWPRFEGIAEWFVAYESERRALGIKPIKTEAGGQMVLGEFTLKGRADRIDRMADGTLSINDYKTGGVPSKREVEAGIEPQLPLLGLIAAQGGFDGLTACAAGELSYWKLGGGQSESSNKVTEFRSNLDALVTAAEAGLRQLVKVFSDPGIAYQAVPKPGRAPRFDDYAHLARLAEWGRTHQE